MLMPLLAPACTRSVSLCGAACCMRHAACGMQYVACGAMHVCAGEDLRRQGLNRIGNMLVPNSNYCKFEDW